MTILPRPLQGNLHNLITKITKKLRGAEPHGISRRCPSQQVGVARGRRCHRCRDSWPLHSSQEPGNWGFGLKGSLISLLFSGRKKLGGSGLRVLLRIIFGEGPLNNTPSAYTRHIRLPMKSLSTPGRVVNQGSTFNKQLRST